MKLTLKNIGKIGTASVEINGITVIAGENDTGKSTVGRALFSVFNSFYKIDMRIKFERIKSVTKILRNFIADEHPLYLFQAEIEKNIQDIVSDIVSNIGLYINNTEAIISTITPLIDNIKADVSFIKQIALRIKEILRVSDEELQKSLLKKNLDVEFNGQISNIFSAYNGEIKLTIKDKCLTISIDEVIITNKFENIYKKISFICNGDVIKDKNSSFGYKKAGIDKILDIRNLSAGLKTFVLLKMLLKNGVIEYNGTIILDEPEIHLHPEWQLLFAELIVLLQKEFGMHILLNTHSPYFLNAVEVYALKYDVNDKCKYYLASVKDGFSVIEDVTYNTELIYSKLARPLQDLENERYQYD